MLARLLRRAGVDPVQWAKDFLTKLGVPVTGSNVQAITAWEQAEGTKAAFNPLATTQGGFAGENTGHRLPGFTVKTDRFGVLRGGGRG